MASSVGGGFEPSSSDADLLMTVSHSETSAATNVSNLVWDLRAAFAEPSVSNIVPIVLHTMQGVESLSGLTGEEKKDLVIRAVVDFLKFKPSYDSSGLLNSITAELVPVLIDSLIAVDKNKIRINPTTATACKNGASGCFSMFSGCSSNSKPSSNATKKA